MSKSPEKIAARKEAARRFNEEHPAGSGMKPKMFAHFNDDIDRTIPSHGKRGHGRLPSVGKTVTQLVRTSQSFSVQLIHNSLEDQIEREAMEVLGTDVTAGSTTPRVILDTNILAANFCDRPDHGTARKLVRLALDERSKIAPLVSMEIIKEYHEVLTRLGGGRPDELFTKILSRSTLIAETPVMEDAPVVEADPSDTMFLYALVQAMREPGGVSVDLITMDGHLLNMERRGGSDQRLQGRILTPKNFLRKLGW